MGELFHTLDQEEKEVLRHTYVNTIHNAKPIKVEPTQNTKSPSPKNKSVIFKLENNKIHDIPNYQ